MDINKNKSSFQFSTPELVESIFIVNQSFNGEESNEFNESLKIITNVSDPETISDKLTRSEVRVSVQNMDNPKFNDKTPYYLLVTMRAFFSFSNAFNTREKYEPLLKINAAALLFSYIRPKITSLTAESRFKTRYLPFIDFTKSQKN